jgi:glycosyltransferase involved in cell wall biosynthesis
MPPITAMLHCHNDAARLGRALETLRACDEILLLDHGSSDRTVEIARQYGANVQEGVHSDAAIKLSRCPWVLCLLPSESVSESLEAALYEWRCYEEQELTSVAAASIFVREQRQGVWLDAAPQTRLVRRSWEAWANDLPLPLQGSMLLQGDLLRFVD